MRHFFFLFLLGCQLVSLHLSAQDFPLSKFGIDTTAAVPEGLPVGMYAPLFVGQDGDGNQVALSEVLKQSSAVVVFVQGAWSRYDRKFLETLNDSIETISVHAAQVIVVSSEKPALLEALRGRYPALKLISDADASICGNYDVLYGVTKAHARRYNLFKRAKLSERQVTPDKLPAPAVYAIAPSGKIVWRYFSLDRKQRPKLAEVGEAVKGIANQRR